jgi:hypothetical protein
MYNNPLIRLYTNNAFEENVTKQTKKQRTYCERAVTFPIMVWYHDNDYTFVRLFK